MKVFNINIKNKKINFIKQELEFKNNGLYLLRGRNGVGKSLIIKSIVFNKGCEYEFNKEEKEAFENNRGGLISYVDQHIYEYKISIEDFIKKGNDTISNEAIQEFMKMLDLEHLALKDDYYQLSGGEKHKISIITALLKETPYLILDEPTNHLDDQSVEKLCEYLNEYALEHIVVVVTHDPRVSFVNYEIVEIDDNVIKQDKKDTAVENIRHINEKIKFNKKKFSKLMGKGIANIISIMVCFLLCMVLSVYNDNIYFEGYCDDKDEYKKDTILVYYAECEYGQLNKEYVDATKIKVEESKKEELIEYNDLQKISNYEGLEEIIICNDNTLYGRIDKVLEGKSSEISVFNIPNDIYMSYEEIASIGINQFGDLLVGEYPKDYENEICITKEVAQEKYGKDIDLKDVLGKKFNYNKKNYMVSGVLDNQYKVCLISYDGESDYGYVNYENSSEKVEISDILIKTKKGEEESVLNKLVENYPATNFISSVFLQKTKTISNTRFLMYQVLPIGIGLSIIFGVIMLFIKKNQIKMEIDILRDFTNYYFLEKEISNIYMKKNMCQVFIIAIMSSIYNIIGMEYGKYNWYLLLVYIIIAYMPSFVFVIRRLKQI